MTMHALMDQFARHTRREELMNQMLELVSHLLLAHVAQDTAVITSCLDDYLASRPRLREKLEERLEGERLRKAD